MKLSLIAKKYTKALFDVALSLKASAGSDVFQKILNQLSALNEVLAVDSDTAAFFNSPFNSLEQKKAVLAKALANQKLFPEISKLLILLVERNRIQILPEVVQYFQQLVDLENGVTRGTCVSAAPLPQDVQQKIEAIISKTTAKKVILTYSVDATLGGGVVAQVGGWTFEDSLKTHMNLLNEDLNRRLN